MSRIALALLVKSRRGIRGMRAYFFSMIVKAATATPPTIIRVTTAGLSHAQDVPPRLRGIYIDTNTISLAGISHIGGSSISMRTRMQIVATREAARPIQSICLALAFQLPPTSVSGRKAIEAIAETHARTGGI